jgi:hypothetical protein
VRSRELSGREHVRDGCGNHRCHRLPSRGNLEGDSPVTSGFESASWRRAGRLAPAWKRRFCRRRTSQPPSAYGLKTNDDLSAAPAGAPRKVPVWCRADVQNSMCRQTLASRASRERQFALSCRQSVGCPPLPQRKRVGAAHLFGGATGGDIGFLRALEDLRWDIDVPGKTRTALTGRCTLRRGAEVH